MGSAASPLPYWQVNVPEYEREAECPEFLRNVNDKDRAILSTPDSDYAIQSWTQVQDIVSADALHLFQRKPSDLRRYLAYNTTLKQKYGSVMAFVVQQRLHWEDASATRPDVLAQWFAHPQNWKILWNDWPYGIDARIVHLVVWTRFELVEDPATDRMIPAMKSALEAFVDEVFISKLGADNVIWFKNWKSLKSIHAVEHFHVMLFDPPAAYIDEITHGDIPLSRKLAN